MANSYEKLKMINNNFLFNTNYESKYQRTKQPCLKMRLSK